jgi:hypothetical protein
MDNRKIVLRKKAKLIFTFPKKAVVQQEVKKLYDINREQNSVK